MAIKRCGESVSFDIDGSLQLLGGRTCAGAGAAARPPPRRFEPLLLLFAVLLTLAPPSPPRLQVQHNVAVAQYYASPEQQDPEALIAALLEVCWLILRQQLRLYLVLWSCFCCRYLLHHRRNTHT
jgi:hypothetical protein